MKKLILAAIALTIATGVYAQGTVNFVNRISGQTFNQTVHIWGPSASNPGLSIIGIGSNDSPTGTAAFGAANGMAMIGASGTAGKFGAATTFAQLIGGTGSLIPETSLVPVGPINTFRTGAAQGNLAVFTANLTAVAPNTFSIGSDLSSAAGWTFEIVAWDNNSGQYPTWVQASSAWLKGDIAAGHSGEFVLTSVGGATPATYFTQLGANMTSFNLYFIPEPSCFALAGLGAATLLIFRRRK